MIPKEILTAIVLSIIAVLFIVSALFKVLSKFALKSIERHLALLDEPDEIFTDDSTKWNS